MDGTCNHRINPLLLNIITEGELNDDENED